MHRAFSFNFLCSFTPLFAHSSSDITSPDSSTEIKINFFFYVRRYCIPTSTGRNVEKMNAVILFHLVAILASYGVAQLNEECPALFLRYSETHTYCKPVSQTCNVLRTLVTEDDISVILKEHNNMRSKLAIGGENGLPTAADMLEMVWDHELAAVAQKHAAQCMFAHDCPNCRRVQNYGVGQNLAIEEITNSPNVPDPNWQSAIQSWYDEIKYFPVNAIDPFIASSSEPTYGHFSQLFWAQSWRIGCGYVLHQEVNTYKKLYVCNYGPAGNIMSGSMYKTGPPCSACPLNSCCDKTCAIIDYSGLCKMTSNDAPKYSPEGNYIFYCDFNNQSDCNIYSTGENKWLLYNTLSGNYLGIVLKGGEESTVVFKNRIKPSTSTFCFVIMYRKGANIAGQEDGNTATETFTITDNNFEFKQNLPDFSGITKQQFSQYSMSLNWNLETEFKITFSVPPGKPEQFLEIQSLYVTEGPCGQ